MRVTRNCLHNTIHAASIADLLSYDHADYSVQIGYVSRPDHEYRCHILLDDSTVPATGEPTPHSISQYIYSHVAQGTLAPLARIFLDQLNICGWFAVALDWSVDPALLATDEETASQQRLSTTMYLDQETGRLTRRINKTANNHTETEHKPEPAEGWTQDNGGTLVATMSSLRDTLRVIREKRRTINRPRPRT